jgi:hypothetical protein
MTAKYAVRELLLDFARRTAREKGVSSEAARAQLGLINQLAKQLNENKKRRRR